MAKSQRRSRSPKIDVGHAEPREYSPSAEIWGGMEKALSKPIPTDTRDQIKIVIERYFKERSFETSAPSKKDVLKRIRAIRDAASKLQRVVLDAQWDVATGQPALSKIKVCMATPDSEADPFDDAQVTSSATTAIPGIDSDDVMHTLVTDLLSRVVVGAELAEQKVKAAASISDGEAWQQMAWDMKSLFESCGLPFGASHEGNAGETSPFVRFFIQLQNSFPDEIPARHYNGSPATLAKEINRAVRARSGDKPEAE